MSFTRCLPANVMLLLLFSTLLNPELLNFGSSVHCLSRSWHEEWKAAHKKEMHVALPVDFWLLSATTVTLEALSWSPEGRGPGAGGVCRGKWARQDAGALPLVPTGATCALTPCPTTCPFCAPPTLSSGVCLPRYMYRGQTLSMVDHRAEKPLPHLVPPAVRKATPQLRQRPSPSGDEHP